MPRPAGKQDTSLESHLHTVKSQYGEQANNMETRHKPRVAIKLPVRVFGIDADSRPFNRMATTLDISFSGVRINGLGVRLEPGDIVGVQHGAEKGRFRVVWKQESPDGNGSCGLQCLQPVDSFWGVPFPEKATDSDQRAGGGSERRRYSRYHCELGVEIRTDPEAAPMHARCTDISQGGCYVETWSPLPVGTNIEVVLRLPNGSLRASALVRAADPSFGMGVEFLCLDRRNCLDRYLSQQQSYLAASLTDAADASQPVQNEQEPETDASPEVFAAESPARFRVLLADDSKFLRSAYSQYLRRVGYEVVVADDGDQALHLASTIRPDVVVLDLLMPKIGGVAALKLMKQSVETAATPVIILSGLPSSNSAKLTSAGAFAYLAKTEVGPEELPSFVQLAIDRRYSSPVIAAGQTVSGIFSESLRVCNSCYPEQC